jgi:hypothetical protein
MGNKKVTKTAKQYLYIEKPRKKMGNKPTVFKHKPLSREMK